MSVIKLGMFAAEPVLSSRLEKEIEHVNRDSFMRDRDRILYSKEFRRLNGKTQVFVSGFQDDLRTRLTHTLEVSQISKTIAKLLDLNETLAEAIALGHDVGHTPFGHVGERVLNSIMNGCEPLKDFQTLLTDEDMGFKHNFQSIRVVSQLENMSRDFEGLNLTNFALWGILNHSKLQYPPCKLKHNEKCGIRRNSNKCPKEEEKEPILSLGFYNQLHSKIDKQAWTIEALIVRMADEIAQRNHDLQDGIFADIIDQNELFDFLSEKIKPFMNEKDKNRFERLGTEKNKTMLVMGHSQILINTLVNNMLEESGNRLLNLARKYGIENNVNFHEAKSEIDDDIFELIQYPDQLRKAESELQEFLMHRIISSYTAQKMDGKADYVIRQLFKCFVSNPQQLPDNTILRIYKNMGETITTDYSKDSFESIVGNHRAKLRADHRCRGNEKFDKALLRTVCDYIAGMTDKYALKIYKDLYEADQF